MGRVTGTVAPPLILKPRLRGVLHQWACAASVVFGVLVVAFADGGEERLAAAVYAASVTGLFGASALYHRVTWRRPAVAAVDAPPGPRDDLRPHRGDVHAVRAARVRRRDRPALLISVWTARPAASRSSSLWIDAPKWLGVVVYLGARVDRGVDVPGARGGARARPDRARRPRRRALHDGRGHLRDTAAGPGPAVFGYHEVFHLLVVIAAALQYAVVVFWVLL